MDLSLALPTFAITLREGFEAALVVGIVLACLEKAGRSRLNGWVYRGIGAGIVASFLVGFLLRGILLGVDASPSPYVPMIKEFLAALFGAIAVVMLSWMLIWMTRQAKSLKSSVENEVKSALTDDNGAGKAVFLLVFIAVLREGFETVLFILARFQGQWGVQAIGASAGLIVATLLGVLLFAGGIKINIRLFFQIMGIFLLLIVGGLALGVCKHLDAAIGLLSSIDPFYARFCLTAPASCLLGPLVWDGSGILSERTFPGILLKALFGYRERLFLGQIIVYIAFLGIIGGIYLRSGFDRPPVKVSVENRIENKTENFKNI
ncbi:FTR1 family protein [Pannus brasiliensis CCIBt3594]|uniref:FTR1 family protein n=1 Tax=Pannus brasiliensis CCIBt3594 TaxID=1427578 RepID=A0AAW9QZT2_9CHRO